MMCSSSRQSYQRDKKHLIDIADTTRFPGNADQLRCTLNQDTITTISQKVQDEEEIMRIFTPTSYV